MKMLLPECKLDKGPGASARLLLRPLVKLMDSQQSNLRQNVLI